jgi:glycosyltransferase involved in cell wall biosynthesis
MKILLLNHNVAWSGGTFLRAFHIGHHLALRGHEVDLVSISPAKRWAFECEKRGRLLIHGSPDLFWGRGRTGWDPWDTLRRILRTRSGNWNLVHAFDSRPAVILPALVTRARSVPLVLDWADWWGRGGTIDERATPYIVRKLVEPLETYFEEHFRTKADGTTVISRALEERAIALGVKPESILRMPQGSDVENVVPLSRSLCRQRFGLSENVPIIGYLGALLRGDADLLFNGLRALQQLSPSVRLLLIGRSKLKVPENPAILATGFVSQEDMAAYMGACDLMVLPSKDTIASRGRWPSKINDYLAAGRAIVATQVGDVADLFRRYEIGLATRPDPESFAQGIFEILSDPERRERMGHCAREVAVGELAWPKLVDRLEAFYVRIAV